MGVDYRKTSLLKDGLNEAQLKKKLDIYQDSLSEKKVHELGEMLVNEMRGINDEKCEEFKKETSFFYGIGDDLSFVAEVCESKRIKETDTTFSGGAAGCGRIRSIVKALTTTQEPTDFLHRIWSPDENGVTKPNWADRKQWENANPPMKSYMSRGPAELLTAALLFQTNNWSQGDTIYFLVDKTLHTNNDRYVFDGRFITSWESAVARALVELEYQKELKLDWLKFVLVDRNGGSKTFKDISHEEFRTQSFDHENFPLKDLVARMKSSLQETVTGNSE